MKLRASFSGPDSKAIAAGLGQIGIHPQHVVVEQDTVEIAVPDPAVIEALPRTPIDVATLADRLAEVPFQTAVFGTLHESWTGDLGYEAPRFPGAPISLGWGLAFRGDGHARVVSRRFIDSSPVRVVRAPHDTTVVQFHDLAADASTAAEQAKPGHQHFGTGPSGGVLEASHLYEFIKGLKGNYVPAERIIRVTVERRELSGVELRDAAAARLVHPLGPDFPVDNVVFAFADEDYLQRALPALWRYGFLVERIDGVVRTRVDDTYSPPPNEKPDWVRALGRDDRATRLLPTPASSATARYLALSGRTVFRPG